jgi:hypothetical protein
VGAMPWRAQKSSILAVVAGLPRGEPEIALWVSLADCKSAIQQTTSLRYSFGHGQHLLKQPLVSKSEMLPGGGTQKPQIQGVDLLNHIFDPEFFSDQVAATSAKPLA